MFGVLKVKPYLAWYLKNWLADSFQTWRDISFWQAEYICAWLFIILWSSTATEATHFITHFFLNLSADFIFQTCKIHVHVHLELNRFWCDWCSFQGQHSSNMYPKCTCMYHISYASMISPQPIRRVFQNSKKIPFLQAKDMICFGVLDFFSQPNMTPIFLIVAHGDTSGFSENSNVFFYYKKP